MSSTVNLAMAVSISFTVLIVGKMDDFGFNRKSYSTNEKTNEELYI